MRHNVLVFLGRESPNFVQHRLADTDLSDVMHVPTELDLPQHLAVESHGLCDDARVVAHTDRMPARVRILELEGLGQRLDAGEEEFLEPAGLNADALLET